MTQKGLRIERFLHDVLFFYSVFMSDGEEYASFSKSEVMPISPNQQKDTLSQVLVRTI